MSVGELKGITAIARRNGRGSAQAGAPDAPGGVPDETDRPRSAAASRAIVAPVSGGRADAPHYVRVRHAAPFIAQLVANRIGMPQTRQRRRAAPQEASARYGEADALDPAPKTGTRARRWF